MKKAITLLIVLALTVGTIQALTNRAKKVNAMISNTNIVSVNDNACSDMDFIQSLYYKDKSLQAHYDGKPVKVYVYHEYDGFGWSHNEIEINFTHATFRYDL